MDSLGKDMQIHCQILVPHRTEHARVLCARRLHTPAHKTLTSVRDTGGAKGDEAQVSPRNSRKREDQPPGGSAVKNLPANGDDMGSILVPGRSHRPQSN